MANRLADFPVSLVLEQLIQGHDIRAGANVLSLLLPVRGLSASRAVQLAAVRDGHLPVWAGTPKCEANFSA